MHTLSPILAAGFPWVFVLVVVGFIVLSRITTAIGKMQEQAKLQAGRRAGGGSLRELAGRARWHAPILTSPDITPPGAPTVHMYTHAWPHTLQP